jgi:hypothetical protein
MTHHRQFQAKLCAPLAREVGCGYRSLMFESGVCHHRVSRCIWKIRSDETQHSRGIFAA